MLKYVPKAIRRGTHDVGDREGKQRRVMLTDGAPFEVCRLPELTLAHRYDVGDAFFRMFRAAARQWPCLHRVRRRDGDDAMVDNRYALTTSLKR